MAPGEFDKNAPESEHDQWTERSAGLDPSECFAVAAHHRLDHHLIVKLLARR